MVELLFNQDTGVSLKNYFNETNLHVASKRGNKSIIKLLLQ